MNLDQTGGGVTLKDTKNVKSGAERRKPHSDQNEARLRQQFESLAQRLDDFSSVINQLSQAMALSERERGFESTSNEPPRTISPQEGLSEPALIYRLCSLLDFLRDLYGFGHSGVFLCDRTKGHLESLALSPKPGEEEALHKFEGEIRTLWECEDFQPAIEQKRKEVLSAEKGGSFLVCPFSIADTKDGFWVTRFDRDILPGKRSSEDMILWLELICSCIENSHLRKLAAFAGQRGFDRLGEEKLYSVTQLCRALTHEVNNPLQVIMGRTQLLKINQRKSRDKQVNGKILDAIEESANKICSLLKDLSDHLHRQSHDLTDRGEVNLLHILKSDLALVRYLLNSDKIELRVHLDENLPCVCGSPGQLEMGFLSLMWELRDRLSGGGVVTIQTSTQQGSLCLRLHCAEKTEEEGQGTCLADLGSSDRIQTAAGMLRACGGNLEFGECSPGEATLCFRFKTLPVEGSNQEAVGER